MKRIIAGVILALSVSISTPAFANHDNEPWHCYGQDIETSSHVDWYNEWSGWETVYYDHYYECTDGHWWEWSYQYSWVDGHEYYVA